MLTDKDSWSMWCDIRKIWYLLNWQRNLQIPKIYKFKMLYKICKFKMLYLERANVDRWRLLVNVMIIMFGICWIGKANYKFYKCHKVYKLWVDLKIYKFRMLYLERANVDRWRLLVNVMLFWKTREARKVKFEKRDSKNAKRINRLIECALRTFYCATQLNVIETEV